jgi:hypothetical protein
VKREAAIGRLRAWAERAAQEAQMADTREGKLNWQGQAQVLSSVATYLAGPGAQASDEQIWKQEVAERSNALAAWEQVQEGPEAMAYAGVVAGYDVALTVLNDLMGRSWTVEVRGSHWVNR